MKVVRLFAYAALFVSIMVLIGILLKYSPSVIKLEVETSNTTVSDEQKEKPNTTTTKSFRAIAAPFPPFTSPDFEKMGLAWEICKAALETQEYVVTLDFSPWARALEEAKNGNYDGLLPAYWTEERANWFLYTTHIATIHTGFLRLRSRNDIVFKGGLRTLMGYEIGVGRGYSTTKEFDNADYLKKVEVSTTPQILKMLWRGHLDLAVGGFEYSQYYLNQINSESGFKGIKDGIILIKPPLEKREIFMVISRKTSSSEKKLKDFNSGMMEIRLDGTYEKLLRQYGISE